MHHQVEMASTGSECRSRSSLSEDDDVSDLMPTSSTTQHRKQPKLIPTKVCLLLSCNLASLNSNPTALNPNPRKAMDLVAELAQPSSAIRASSAIGNSIKGYLLYIKPKKQSFSVQGTVDLWSYIPGPTYCLSIDTHIRSKRYTPFGGSL